MVYDFLNEAPKNEIGAAVAQSADQCPEKCASKNIFTKACEKYDPFIVCKTLKPTQTKFECTVETCDETCGTDFCRLKADGQNVCIIDCYFFD